MSDSKLKRCVDVCQIAAAIAVVIGLIVSGLLYTIQTATAQSLLLERFIIEQRDANQVQERANEEFRATLKEIMKRQEEQARINEILLNALIVQSKKQ